MAAAISGLYSSKLYAARYHQLQLEFYGFTVVQQYSTYVSMFRCIIHQKTRQNNLLSVLDRSVFPLFTPSFLSPFHFRSQGRQQVQSLCLTFLSWVMWVVCSLPKERKRKSELFVPMLYVRRRDDG